MNEQTYTKLLEQGLAAVQSRGGAVLDATFSSRARREFLRRECKKAHVRLQVVELDVGRGQIERRLRSREQAAGEISDARLEDLEKLTSAYEPPSELAPELIKVSTSNAVSDTVKSVLLRLSEKQLR